MDDFYRNKLANLVTKIHDQTLSGDIRWTHRGQKSDSGFHADVGGQKIEMGYLQYKIEGEDTVDIEIKIFNKDGRHVETIKDTTLLNVRVPRPDSPGWFSYMDEIVEAAKRQSNGADQAIDSLLSYLSNNEIPF